MPPLDRVVFASSVLRVGLFRCRPWYASFEDTGPIRGHLIVFPRTSVSITHAGGRPIIADPNVVMFYNDQQVYRRGRLSERGDLCEWFEFDPLVVAEAIRPFDPRVADRPDRPFAQTHGPSDQGDYLLQRLVVDHILGADAPDALYIEETMLAVLGRAVAGAYRAHGRRPPLAARPCRATAELARDVQTLLATSFQERLSLDRLAREVHCSPYHLCRVFRAATGRTIHGYLNQIRLRTALEFTAQGRRDLAALSVELGYSSHSHFTQAFKRAFGVVPSELCGTASTRRISELSKNLIARAPALPVS
jgi:AraC-like DNA-binding protein